MYAERETKWPALSLGIFACKGLTSSPGCWLRPTPGVSCAPKMREDHRHGTLLQLRIHTVFSVRLYGSNPVHLDFLSLPAGPGTGMLRPSPRCSPGCDHGRRALLSWRLERHQNYLFCRDDWCRSIGHRAHSTTEENGSGNRLGRKGSEEAVQAGAIGRAKRSRLPVAPERRRSATATSFCDTFAPQL